MIEIISIIITLTFLFVFSNFPLNYFYLEKNSIIKYSFNDILLINIIINCNLLLILSFFSINLNLIFFIIFIYVIIFLIIFNKNYLKLFQENFYFCLGFVIFFYAISLTIVKNAYLEYDALAHWIFKVKVFFQEGSIANLKGVPYDYYPHLGSYIWAFFWKNSFLQNEYLGRLFFIYIFLVSIFSIKSKLNKNFTEFEKIIIIFLICFLSINIYLFGGYQEYFLFFSFYCFSHFFLKFNNLSENRSIYPELITLLISNILIWTKQEGFFYFLILSFLYFFHSKRFYINKFFYLIFSIFLFLFFIFIKDYYFESVDFNHEIINSETLKNLQFSYLFSKIIIISKYFFISFVKYPIWLIIFLSLFVLKFQTNYLEKNRFVYTYLILMFGFIYAIFINTPNDLSFLVPVTLNRLVFALSGFLLFLCVEMINKIKN